MSEETIIESTLHTCPDCGASGAGNFCANCGEEMEPSIPKVRQFFSELVSEIVSFDSRVVRTIPALLLRPGFLTKEYLAGRRKRYLLPWRLYSLVAVLSFFFLHALAQSHGLSFTVNKSNFQFSFENSNTDSKAPLASNASKPENQSELSGCFIEITPYVVLLGSAPLFALILLWMYDARKMLYAQHIIFSFHFFTFALFLTSIASFFNSLSTFVPILILFLTYLYFAMRNAYSDKGVGLVIRFAVGVVSYIILVGVGVLISLMLTFAIAKYTGTVT